MKSLRRRVALQMVRFHAIPRKLAAIHASLMSDEELLFRLRFYAGMELSAVSPKNRVVNVPSTQFVTPTTTHADALHSTLFPPETTEEGEVSHA
jgi:hypothetical protein